MEAKRHAEKLRSKLADPRADVRGAALGAIAETGALVDEAAIRPLLKDDAETVRTAAAFALGKVGTEKSLSSLRRAFRKSQPAEAHLRRQILIAMGDIGGPAAFAPLLSTFATWSTTLRDLVLDFVISDQRIDQAALLRRIERLELPVRMRARVRSALRRLERAGERSSSGRGAPRREGY